MERSMRDSVSISEQNAISRSFHRKYLSPLRYVYETDFWTFLTRFSKITQDTFTQSLQCLKYI